MSGNDRKEGWWVINDTDLMRMLRRAHEGEDPEMVFAEHYANSDHETPGESSKGD